MCGPSSQQKELEATSSSFASLLNANYAKNFGAQSSILGNLSNMFTPIVEAGPDQQGWGVNERAAVNTQIGEGVGANYAKASRALGSQLSARGGGSEFLPTGAEASLKGTLASEAANQLSGEQLSATEANYNQGRQNWREATAGLDALAGQYNPNAAAGSATSATGQAYDEAKQNAMQSTQQFSAIAGGIAGLGKSAGDAMTGYAAL